jgi:hypothetical protein
MANRRPQLVRLNGDPLEFLFGVLTNQPIYRTCRIRRGTRRSPSQCRRRAQEAGAAGNAAMRFPCAVRSGYLTSTWAEFRSLRWSWAYCVG